MMAVPVPVDLVGSTWPTLTAWVEAACRRGDRSWTPGDARELCEAGRAGLWLVIDPDGKARGFGVTAIERWPDRSKVGVVVMAGGVTGRQWIPLIADLEHWARAHGARAMVVRGRLGWIKALRDYRVAELGENNTVTLTKDLT